MKASRRRVIAEHAGPRVCSAGAPQVNVGVGRPGARQGHLGVLLRERRAPRGLRARLSGGRPRAACISCAAPQPQHWRDISAQSREALLAGGTASYHRSISRGSAGRWRTTTGLCHTPWHAIQHAEARVGPAHNLAARSQHASPQHTRAGNSRRNSRR